MVRKIESTRIQMQYKLWIMKIRLDPMKQVMEVSSFLECSHCWI